MNVYPILICRTKYVDYNNPVFCAPVDINNSIVKSLHDVIIKGENLRYMKANSLQSNKECKVFISNDQYIVIGKALFIRKLGDSFDVSLDKEADGRDAWGFIGGILSRKEYVAEQKILDLPEEYYVQAYNECLYDSHWSEKEFKGPYISKAFDIKMETLPNLEYPLNISKETPIFPSSMNDSLFRYVAEQTIKGKSVAFCSNEEFNAAKAIIKGALTYATVSESNLHDQIESYQRAITAKRKKTEEYVNNRSGGECTDSHDNNKEKVFYQELSLLCKKYGYKLRRLSDRYDVCGFVIITGVNNSNKSKKDDSFIDKVLGYFKEK